MAAVEDIRPRHEAAAHRRDSAHEVEITPAIVDRLTFGGNIIETGSDSYRLAHTKAQQSGG